MYAYVGLGLGWEGSGLVEGEEFSPCCQTMSVTGDGGQSCDDALEILM